MLARPLRTKRKSASAQRYLRALGATIDMANLIMRPSKGSSQRCIIVWMFTKSQLGGRCGYWVWSPSGNCCTQLRCPTITCKISKKYHHIIQYLRQLRKAKGGLREMNTAQAGDL